ncbi:hypothetical protein FF1_043470 [Malus domestica]
MLPNKDLLCPLHLLSSTTIVGPTMANSSTPLSSTWYKILRNYMPVAGGHLQQSSLFTRRTTSRSSQRDWRWVAGREKDWWWVAMEEKD